MNAVGAEEYESMIREQCIFCKIVDGAIPSKKVYEDSKVLAFLDVNPASLGHTLVITKKHYTVLPQVPDADATHLFKVIKRLTGILFEITQTLSKDKPAGVNIIQNNGAAAGQQVPHVHFHIIPRVEGDGVIQPWKNIEVNEKQADEIQSVIQSTMKPVSINEKPVHVVEEKPTKTKKTKPLKRKPRIP